MVAIDSLRKVITLMIILLLTCTYLRPVVDSLTVAIMKNIKFSHPH